MKLKITLKHGLAISLIILIGFANPSFGQIVTHDLVVKDNDTYNVTGDDPYIIFNAQQTTTKSNHSANYLILDLGDDMSNVALELFFNSDDDRFKPHYKLSFRAAKFPIALALPKTINLDASTRLRLDINQCANCSIDFKVMPVLTNHPGELTKIEPHNVLNGIIQLAINSHVVSANGWKLNSLTGDISGFEISGADPFLVSPRLSISTDQLAGVYFKLQAPSSADVWSNYQLFYQTERHPFSAQASSKVRLTDTLDGIIEFVIPLHFLSKEVPSDSILERLRLDIPEISGQWSLIEVRLVHEKKAFEIKHLVPSQLSHIKQQRATGLGLIKKSVINVTSDLGFSISYLLLLALTYRLFRRAYRSNN